MADIWSKPSKDRNFLRKKIKDLNLDLEFLRHPKNECRNFLGEGGNEYVQDVFCEPRGHGLVGSLTFHLAPDILRPLQPGGDPVTLVTPHHTDHCDYCMCIRLVNKHNESNLSNPMHFGSVTTHRVNNTKKRQLKCKQIQTRVVREVL